MNFAIIYPSIVSTINALVYLNGPLSFIKGKG